MTLRRANVLRMWAQYELIVLAPLACFGILYLVSKVVMAPSLGPKDYIDFQDIWFAGKLWASGKNPYDGSLFPNDQHLSTWFYPPYWYPFVVPFGLLPFQSALSIWKALNLSLLIGGNYLMARAVADLAQQKWLPLFLAGTFYVCFMHAGPAALWIGQTSIIVYFGISALIFGLVKARPPMLMLGLLLLALKPQIGIVAFAAVAALKTYRWAVIPPSIICLLNSAAITITANFRASIEGFIANLPRHSEHDANSPPHLTGLIHILDSFWSIHGGLVVTLSILSAAILCAVVAFYQLPIGKPRTIESAWQTAAGLAVFLATTFFITPLHYYDMISLVTLLMIIIAIPLRGRWLVALGLFLCFRPDYLGRAAGIVQPNEIFECHVMSAGLVLIVTGTVWALLATRSKVNLRSGIGSRSFN